MDQNLKDKLKDLSKDELAELLVDIARKSDSGFDKINRTLSNAKENLKTYRARLRGLKDYKGYVSWKESSSFADELCDLLEYIPKSATSPDQGFDLVKEFIESDKFIFEMADDSSGYIGGIFSSEVSDLFIEYAKEYSDKKKMIKTIRELTEDDGYGARDFIITEANKYLSNEDLRSLFESYYNRPRNRKFSYGTDWVVESLAAQLKDAPLFEKLIRETCDELEDRHYLKIAQNYLDCGDYDTSQDFLDKVSKDDSFTRSNKDDLQKEIYRKTKKISKLEKILRQEFKSYYSKYTLNDLLEVIGKDKKTEICREAIADIMSRKTFSESNADFLKFCKSYDELNAYVLNHAQSLNGDHYYSLLGISEALRKQKKYLSATLIYRSLVDSILRRAKSKTYHHGVDYLKILDKLEGKVTSWEDHLSHKVYFQNINEQHKRKYSFWNRYNDQ